MEHTSREQSSEMDSLSNFTLGNKVALKVYIFHIAQFVINWRAV